jgi:hypothetical protein
MINADHGPRAVWWSAEQAIAEPRLTRRQAGYVHCLARAPLVAAAYGDRGAVGRAERKDARA